MHSKQNVKIVECFLLDERFKKSKEIYSEWQHVTDEGSLVALFTKVVWFCKPGTSLSECLQFKMQLPHSLIWMVLVIQ